MSAGWFLMLVTGPKPVEPLLTFTETIDGAVFEFGVTPNPYLTMHWSLTERRTGMFAVESLWTADGTWPKHEEMYARARLAEIVSMHGAANVRAKIQSTPTLKVTK